MFAPDAPLITVVAQAGEVTGSPMDITWSQVTDEGEEELFTHTVEVASFDAAYSVGESPGTLTPGTYRVEATLEGESRSTQFEVAAPEGTDATGEGATSGPPVSGDSGAVGPPVDPASGAGETALYTFVDWAPVDPDASTVWVRVVAGVRGGGGRVEVKATMAGNTRTFSFPTNEEGLVIRALELNPCFFPGGSDLPGTKATFDTTLYEGNTAGPSNLDFTTLGPDETPPVLEVNSSPAPGSTVEPGETITVQIVGTETREGTWQTGVKQIRLTDFDVFYTVPENAPGEIRLMAEAFDFAEERGSFGLSYFTGEVWKGRVTGRTTQPGCSPSSVRVTGVLEIVVRGEGTVTGSVTEKRGAFSCFGTEVPRFMQTYPISGRKTAAAFELTASGTSVTMPISGTRASATFTHGSGGYSATVTYTITCVSCEEAAG